MKKDADYFGDDPPEHAAELIFVAKRLKDALRLEGILTEAEVDFAVEPDEYQGGIIFKTARIGAFFYVRREARARAVEVLLGNGYVPVDEEGVERPPASRQ
jgi:hypothetical protein